MKRTTMYVTRPFNNRNRRMSTLSPFRLAAELCPLAQPRRLPFRRFDWLVSQPVAFFPQGHFDAEADPAFEQLVHEHERGEPNSATNEKLKRT